MTTESDFKTWARDNPEEALKLVRKLKDKVVVPHPGQRPIVDSEARFKVVNCGRRWGKTVIAAKLLINATMAAPPGSVTWWVAPTYKVVKRGYREVLRQLPREYLTHDPPPDTNFDAGRSVILRFKNGTQIEFYSAERPEGMLGEGVKYAVLDEAATMPSRIWQQIVSPTLMDKQGGACLISTPRGRNWFYKAWQRGQDPGEASDNWESWTFPTESNPHIAPGEITEMKHSLPTVIFEQEVLAKFVAAGSSVFQFGGRAVQTSAIYDNGLVEDTPPKGTVFLGIDLAKTDDYTVLYGARETDRRNVYFERFNSLKWSEQKRRIKRAVRNLMLAGAETVILVMDATGVGDPIVEDMEDAGFDVIGVNFTGTKNKMVSGLAKDLESGHAFVLEDGHIVEFENYQMSQTPLGRITFSAPEGEKDDVVSAKMLSHYGMVNEGAPAVTNLTAAGAAEEEPKQPWELEDGEIEEDGDYSDLVDDADLNDPRAADEAIGLITDLRPLSVAELLQRDDVWV